MRILIAGCGAVGSWMAAVAHSGGADVTAVARGPHGEAIARNGLLVRTRGQAPSLDPIHLRVVPATSAATGVRFDLAVVAVKSYDTPTVAEELSGLVPQPTAVLSVQNGIGNEGLLTDVGLRVYAGSLTTSVRLTDAGQIAVGGRGGLGLAPYADSGAVPASLVTMLRQGGMRTAVYPAAEPMKWSKLLLNHTAAASSAALRWPPWRCLRHQDLFDVERAAWLEVLAVMWRLGWGPVALPGYPVPAMARIVKWTPAVLLRPAAWRAVRLFRQDRLPGLAADIIEGKHASEIGRMHGAVADAAEDDAVLNRRMAHLVNRLASGSLDPSAFIDRPEVFVEALRTGRWPASATADSSVEARTIEANGPNAAFELPEPLATDSRPEDGQA